MRFRNALVLPALGLVALAMLTPACSSWPNEEKPLTSRLDTVPSGATVHIRRLSMGPLYAPLDLPAKVRRSDTIIVTMAGYKKWEKQLSEAWQPAEKTYRVVLVRDDGE